MSLNYDPEPGDYIAARLERDREILAKARLDGREIAPILEQFGTWVVTEAGVECLTDTYQITRDVLFRPSDLNGWENHMAAKTWVNMADFLAAFYTAREIFNLVRTAGDVPQPGKVGETPCR